MATQIFVNLPVKNLLWLIEFFTRSGYKFNPQFTDEKATCMIVSDDIFVMRWNMSENKATVERYIAGLRQSNHAQILSCLTEDVEWDMPGAFHLVGKNAFDKEIENAAFVGSPTISTTRMVEENDVVIAEGTVRVQKIEGGFLNAVFCDVFAMRNANIRRLTTYLVEVKQAIKRRHAWPN